MPRKQSELEILRDRGHKLRLIEMMVREDSIFRQSLQDQFTEMLEMGRLLPVQHEILSLWLLEIKHSKIEL